MWLKLTSLLEFKETNCVGFLLQEDWRRCCSLLGDWSPCATTTSIMAFGPSGFILLCAEKRVGAPGGLQISVSVRTEQAIYVFFTSHREGFKISKNNNEKKKESHHPE